MAVLPTTTPPPPDRTDPAFFWWRTPPVHPRYGTNWVPWDLTLGPFHAFFPPPFNSPPADASPFPISPSDPAFLATLVPQAAFLPNIGVDHTFLAQLNALLLPNLAVHPPSFAKADCSRVLELAQQQAHLEAFLDDTIVPELQAEQVRVMRLSPIGSRVVVRGKVTVAVYKQKRSERLVITETFDDRVWMFARPGMVEMRRIVIFYERILECWKSWKDEWASLRLSLFLRRPWLPSVLKVTLFGEFVPIPCDLTKTCGPTSDSSIPSPTSSPTSSLSPTPSLFSPSHFPSVSPPSSPSHPSPTSPFSATGDPGRVTVPRRRPAKDEGW